MMAGIKKDDPTPAAAKEESKAEAVGEGSAKNKKKKEKAKAKAAEAAKLAAAAENKTETKELTPEERKAAIQEALKKRNAKQTTVDAEGKNKASIIQSEKEKRGFKKAKNFGSVVLHD